MSSKNQSILKRVFQTVPNDKEHFPSTNQAHYCWQKYNEYVLCLKKNLGDEDACIFARYEANSICPEMWMDDWDEQRAKGVFLGVQEHSSEPHNDSVTKAAGGVGGKHH